jgi:hypothetical protein
MQPYTEFFDLFGAYRFWLTDILSCIVIAYTTCVFGVAFGKSGRSPYLGLLLLVPLIGVCALWVLGVARWPQEEKSGSSSA